MSDDPVDEMELGETETVATLTEINALEAGWDEYGGQDREADNFRIAETEVVDEQVAVVIEADVTKVDPDTKPVFQSEDRWQGRSDVESQTPRWLSTLSRIAPYGVTAAALGASWFLAQRVITRADMTMNGEQVGAPSFGALAPMLFLVLIVVWMLQYRSQQVRRPL